MAREALSGVHNIEVIAYGGLIANCLMEHKATVLICGPPRDFRFRIRVPDGFYKQQHYRNAETVFLMPSENYTYLKSSMVKQISRLGGDVGTFVPDCVVRGLAKKTKR